MANSGKQWLAVHDALKKSQKDKRKKKPAERPKKNQGGLLGKAIKGLRDRRRALEDL
jgi:hypothetical protein